MCHGLFCVARLREKSGWRRTSIRCFPWKHRIDRSLEFSALVSLKRRRTKNLIASGIDQVARALKLVSVKFLADLSRAKGSLPRAAAVSYGFNLSLLGEIATSTSFVSPLRIIAVCICAGALASC